jgi:hypothetical protein
MRLWPALAIALPLPAAGADFGVKAGVPATVYFATGRNEAAEYSAATRRYVLGAFAEWRATPSFGVGLEALYHRMGYVAIVSSAGAGERTTSAVDYKGHSFDFVLLARRYLGRRGWAFFTGGAVARYAGPVRGRGERITEDLAAGSLVRTPIDTRDPPELRQRFYPALTAGAGVAAGLGPLRLVPEFRYTRWIANLGVAGGLLRFAPNQAELLLGFGFGR